MEALRRGREGSIMRTKESLMKTTDSGKWRVFSAKDGDKVSIEHFRKEEAQFGQFDRVNTLAINTHGYVVLFSWTNPIWRNKDGRLVKCLPTTLTFHSVKKERPDPDGGTLFVLKSEPRFELDKEDQAELSQFCRELEGIG